MEGRFCRDLSHVRIHSDDRAGRLADDLGARAFTLRNHIVFGSGKFAPHAPSGRRLLVHELAHVLQQQPEARDAGVPVTLDGWRLSAPERFGRNGEPNALPIVTRAARWFRSASWRATSFKRNGAGVVPALGR